MHVAIESYQDASTITSIVFKQATTDTAGNLVLKSEFSCVVGNDNKVRGFYKHEQNDPQEKFVGSETNYYILSLKKISADSPNKLMCKFDAVRKKVDNDDKNVSCAELSPAIVDYEQTLFKYLYISSFKLFKSESDDKIFFSITSKIASATVVKETRDDDDDNKKNIYECKFSKKHILRR